MEKRYNEEQINSSIVREFIGKDVTLTSYHNAFSGTAFMLPTEELKKSMDEFARSIQEAVNSK